MKRTLVRQALNATDPMDHVLVKGWVRTRRDSKDFSFLEINDGSCLQNVQVIVDADASGYAAVKEINTGAAVAVSGTLVASPGKGQAWEIRARRLELIGQADAHDYPLQKKRHSDEFLRSIAHLRPRTNKFGALFRIRSESAFAVHNYFRERGFFHLHTPIITGSDCEGAGELFRVTALPPTAAVEPGEDNPHARDFFGKEANLTVSGQLEAEPFASALGAVYTFGPTFRAENSNTPRHAAEFWMIEPEVAFSDLDDNMDLAEDLVKHLVAHVMDNCSQDLELFTRWVDKKLTATLEMVTQSEYQRVPYREAVSILNASGRKFDFPVHFGADLQTEHERFLCEDHFKKPVIVHDYPKTIKPFYMRLNDDNETVAAMDLLVPRVGELVGGSQREERHDVLRRRMQAAGMSTETYWWYLDIRRFGSVPHSGFGLGFERLLMLLTGVTNIRDVIPFPRTPRNLEF